MTSPLYFCSPPLTTGIPLEALRSAEEVSARRRSPITMIRRQQLQLVGAPGASAVADVTRGPHDPGAAFDFGGPHDAEAPASEASSTLAVAWQLAARVGQLLGSGAPRSLVARGPSLELLVQDPPAGSAATRNCA